MGLGASKGVRVGTVSELYVYPLKGGRGFATESASIVESGFQGDRDFVLVDSTNNFISQRKYAKLACIVLRIIEDGKKVYVSGDRITEGLSVPLVKGGEEEVLTVWGKECRGYYQGDEISAWFNEFLGTTGFRLFVSLWKV